MPYPRYNSYSSRSSMNPWDGGSSMQGLLPTPGGQVNPLALVNNLVGALMNQQTMGQNMGMSHSRDDRRRGRSRSPLRRGAGRARSRSRDRRRGSPVRRKRSPPADRAEHEIYIGNYPAGYREDDLKNLFSEFLIDVGKIRMKSDGHKVYAFAETNSMDLVQKAIKVMDGKEIKGRRLRVRGSKDTDKKKKHEERVEKKADRQKERVPTVEDSKMHLITAFVAFIDRELAANSEEANEDFKGLLEASKTALTAAYKLPNDQTYKISREIEDIFFKAARLEIKLPEEPLTEMEIKDDGNDEKDIKIDSDAQKPEVELEKTEAEKSDPEDDNDEVEDQDDAEKEDEPDVEDATQNEIDIDDEEKIMDDIEKALADDDDDVNNEETPDKASKESSNAALSKGRPTRGRRTRK